MQAVSNTVSVGLLSQRSLALLLLGALLFLGAWGCGAGGIPSFEVRGKVTYQKKNITSGSVTFAPIGGGKLIVTAISETGEYQLEAPAGKYEVAVTSIAEVIDGPEGFDQKTSRPLLPERFSFPSRSGITATVEAIELNEIDLAMP